MNEVAPTTGLVQWRPNVGPLRDRWGVLSIRVTRDRYGYEAEIELGGPRLSFIRLRVGEQSPPVGPWLNDFLEAFEKVPGKESGADLDLRPHWYWR